MISVDRRIGHGMDRSSASRRRSRDVGGVPRLGRALPQAQECGAFFGFGYPAIGLQPRPPTRGHKLRCMVGCAHMMRAGQLLSIGLVY